MYSGVYMHSSLGILPSMIRVLIFFIYAPRERVIWLAVCKYRLREIEYKGTHIRRREGQR
jgi:hypothetical protein